VIDHIGFEVADLRRSTRFYDAVLFAIGARRVHSGAQAIAYGTDGPCLWLVVRGRRPAPGYGHLALRVRGRAAVDAAHAAGVRNGGFDDGTPAPRPAYGPSYYSGYLRDPDGLRLELVAGSS
jgi:catechol 2,3-dioxygenase-like lactoylglutathione lyase family enzyme